MVCFFVRSLSNRMVPTPYWNCYTSCCCARLLVASRMVEVEESSDEDAVEVLEQGEPESEQLAALPASQPPPQPSEPKRKRCSALRTCCLRARLRTLKRFQRANLARRWLFSERIQILLFSHRAWDIAWLLTFCAWLYYCPRYLDECTS